MHSVLTLCFLTKANLRPNELLRFSCTFLQEVEGACVSKLLFQEEARCMLAVFPRRMFYTSKICPGSTERRNKQMMSEGTLELNRKKQILCLFGQIFICCKLFWTTSVHFFQCANHCFKCSCHRFFGRSTFQRIYGVI